MLGESSAGEPDKRMGMVGFALDCNMGGSDQRLTK